MIKMIVSDMDGTLLDDSHKVSEEFWSLLKQLQSRGIVFVAASGRQYFNLLSIFDDVKDDIYFVAENGTYMVHAGEELFLNALPRDEADTLIREARKIEHADIVVCGKRSAYVEASHAPFIEEVRKYYTKCEIVDDLSSIDDDILKVTICDITGAEANSYPFLKQFSDDYQVVISGKIWIDMVKKDANKGVAVKKLQKILGIRADQTIAFGDYMNDAEMLGDAHFSFAMEDAHPEVKKIARYQAGSNNENGVVEAIRLLIPLDLYT